MIEVVGGEFSRSRRGPSALGVYRAAAWIGTGVAEICALADFDVNDGPMLGSSHLECHGPIRIGSGTA